MKTIYLIPITCILTSSFGCGGSTVPVNAVPPPIATPTSASPVPTTATPKDGNYNGKGKVTKVNTQIGSVELDHEEIAGLMPRMIMEFYVKDKALLNGLAVGDTVDFVIEYKHPAETVVSIKKIN
ncbi:MAG TPA: copper-binding protein [Pyrinomonadaceae bacterium]|nr:copper-binding protein [Pyrinomonadaceae bacterium]